MQMNATTQIHVSDFAFDCADCANTIERVLMKEEGIETTAIDERERRLEVRFDQSRTSEDRIERLVEEWGYDQEAVSG